jgi:N-acetylmuramoyl-L-alanine amidase
MSRSKIFAILLILPLILLSAPIIAIDTGHTPKRYGCTSARGVPEFLYNQRIAIELLMALQDEKIDSFMINENSSEIGLLERTKEAKDRGATLFISIHHDSVQSKFLSTWEFNGRDLKYSDNFKGYSMFISLKNKYAKESKRFANTLGKKLLKSGFTPTLHHTQKIKGEYRELIDKEKGIYRFDGLAVLRTATIPAILLECGVIVNRDNETLINTKAYRSTLVKAIVDSIKKLIIQ